MACPRLLAAALFHLVPALAAAQTAFTFRAIDPLPGDDFVVPRDMNEHGDFVGDSVLLFTSRQAVAWIDGVAIPLGTLPGTNVSNAVALNQRREVVGTSWVSGSIHPRSWIWDPVGGMRELFAPAPLVDPYVHDMNDDGTIVGTASDASGFRELVRWDRAGNAVSLGRPAGFDDVVGADINSRGEISSTAMGPSFLESGYVIDTSGTTHLLPSPTTGNTSAIDLNDAGQVCGCDENFQLVRWDAYAPVALGYGNDPIFAPGHAINSQGWIIIGSGPVGDELYEAGTFRRILDLLPASLGAADGYVTALAENGCLVGLCSDVNFAPITAFVLEPPTRLEVEGGQIGGTVAFRHVAPSYPNKIAATLVSLTGMAGSFHVGRGVHVRLDFDFATSILLGFPGIGVLTLDGSGNATTAAIDVDNDPALSGLPAWACSVVFQGGKIPPVPSTTVPFILE